MLKLLSRQIYTTVARTTCLAWINFGSEHPGEWAHFRSWITSVYELTYRTCGCSFLSYNLTFDSKKVSSKVRSITWLQGPGGEYRCSFTRSLTSALVGGGWSTPLPDLTSGKDTRYPVYRKLGGAQGRSEQMRKISPPPEFDPRAVQPVASRYTDYAIKAHIFLTVTINKIIVSSVGVVFCHILCYCV
jgi:hypothetical protein